MWATIRDLILSLFGRKTNKTDQEAQGHRKDVEKYESSQGINITAIISNKLSTLTVAECNVGIVGDSKRAELLNNLINAAWYNAQEITSRSYGSGGVALIPYVVNGSIYTDIVSKDRFYITRSQGTDILGATVLADVIIRGYKKYMRFIDYALEGNTYVIRNRATCENTPCQLDILPEWAGIQEELTISNVNRLLLGYLKSPFAKGRTDNLYGVAITRGSEAIIGQISDCLDQIQREFKKKDAKVFADSALFDKNDKVSADLFKKVMGGGSLEQGAFFEIFDPAFRDTSYYNRLENLFALLEKSIGTSRGILTEPQSIGATATEIKRGTYDTFALISSMRKQWEKTAEDLLYSFDILCNAFNLSPTGSYEIKWDWSNSMVESSTETWQQLKDGQSIGVIQKAELRQRLNPSETLEEAQAVINEIAENEPSMSYLMGE